MSEAATRTGLPAPLTPPDMTEEEIVAALIGGWEMERWTAFYPDGSEQFPFGEDVIGLIMYSADGHMGCHLSRANRPLLNAPSIFDVPDLEMGQSIRGFSAYFGTYSVDAKAGIVTHHVTGSWYPDFAMVDQPRRFALDGDRLSLEAEVGGVLQRLVWRRRNSGTLPAHRS